MNEVVVTESRVAHINALALRFGNELTDIKFVEKRVLTYDGKIYVHVPRCFRHWPGKRVPMVYASFRGGKLVVALSNILNQFTLEDIGKELARSKSKSGGSTFTPGNSSTRKRKREDSSSSAGPSSKIMFKLPPGRRGRDCEDCKGPCEYLSW